MDVYFSCNRRYAASAVASDELPTNSTPENSVRIDYVTESPNVSGDDRSVLPLPDPVRLAIQVEEST